MSTRLDVEEMNELFVSQKQSQKRKSRSPSTVEDRRPTPTHSSSPPLDCDLACFRLPRGVLDTASSKVSLRATLVRRGGMSSAFVPEWPTTWRQSCLRESVWKFVNLNGSGYGPSKTAEKYGLAERCSTWERVTLEDCKVVVVVVVGRWLDVWARAETDEEQRNERC